MNILVTGGAGFFGSHIADALMEAGHSVSIIDTLATGRRQNLPPKAPFFHERAGGVNSCQGWDWIIHAAAVVGVEHVEKHPQAVLADAWVAGEMAVIAKSLKARMCFISSSEVYDLTPDLTPRWNYAISKRFAEAWVQAKIPNALIVRPFNMVGPRQRPDFGMVLPRFVQACLENRPLPRVLPGTQCRSFLHVQDAADAILALLEANAEGCYDVGGDTPVSITDLGHLIADVLNKEITWEDLPPREHDVPVRKIPHLDPLRELGWAPKRTLVDAIRDLAKEME